MTVSQATFRAALLDPAAPVPEGLTDAGGRPAGRRFDVYRNNVIASLAAALETGFPAVRAVIGAERFRGLAIAFCRAHPPDSPLMMHAGGALPAFLERTAVGRRWPALPDLARLELALRESYHAADAAPVDPAALGAVPPEALAGLRLRLAPSLRLVPSRHALAALHRAALAGAPPPGMGTDRGPDTATDRGPDTATDTGTDTGPGAGTDTGPGARPGAPPGAASRANAETAPAPASPAGATLITRPGFDPQATDLAPPEAAFVAALARGEALGPAADSGTGHDPAFSPAAALGTLLQGGAIVSLVQESAP